MKQFKFKLIPVFILLLSSCGMSQSEKTVLKPAAFQEKITATENATIVDVRTTEEFAGGHLENATNIDWTSDGFDAKISKLDKSNPYFVYCLSGGRSAAAAEHMRELGFKEVYEMDGGMMKWRSDGLPEVMGTATPKNGMTTRDYQELINDDKIVLVDFYAEWCGPCKKMKPSLEEISKEMQATVKIVRIDVDQNPELAKELEIDALPTILIYKNKEISWRNVGYAEKVTLVEHLK
ncbi:MAG: thioredoxin [Candidatus Fluviicola riflensis]|nr:MAG: thioredoxin [Candidatus Fluviicola riflensis]OGS79227.1 MAG: thioredoxin [Candidatus Fluviicola riflensis]OGS86659.1 MAG: thioredoxin [Fluviicola sp. RIFCSPHIGHO2_01_FULL_43_53]OGS88867.1 MAG: thioredoxin [Fluviicola sp. RIFCSPHIGHO2_12_FULL_43_24]